jgi:hypothetical protein
MGSLIIWIGIALSELGIGYFFPVTVPFGAGTVALGAVVLLLEQRRAAK